MILFPDDIEAVNELLQQRAGLDHELVEACSEHIELEQYNEVVFKAFRVLEGRIQRRSGIQGKTANKTLNEALDSQGSLTRKLGLTIRQAANLRDLLCAAFAVFRNPEAHPQEAIVDYGSAECQAVLAFVNLMLGILDRQPEDPLQAALKHIRREIGAQATGRLEQFLDRILTLDWKIDQTKLGFSFKARSLRATQEGALPKRIRTTVFFLRPGRGNPRFVFLANWRGIAGINHQSHADRLRALGCVEGWSSIELDLYLRDHNSAEMFEQLYIIVRDIVGEMEQSLAAQKQDTR